MTTGMPSEPDRPWRFPAVAQEAWTELEESASNSEPSRRKAAKDIEDRGGAERDTTTDYGGRYPIELLQNAHDANEDAGLEGHGRVWFHLSDQALIIANEGVPFDEAHVDALMRYGASTKAAEKGDAKSIGYKGVGFSSVFEITKNPQIVSRGIGFQFDRDRGRQLVEKILRAPVKRIPLRGYPLRLEPVDLGGDAAVVERLIAAGAVTVIRLPLDNGVPAEAVGQLCEELLQPGTLLFMAGIDRLAFGGLLGDADWTRTTRPGPGVGTIHQLANGDEERSWLVVDSTVDVEADELDGLKETVWETVTELNVAVGIPWGVSGPEAQRAPQNLHVYFPTDVALGRSLIVHGDFFVDSSRKHLLTGHHFDTLNDRVRDASAELLADTIEALVPTYGPRALHVLKSSGTSSEFGKRWWNEALGYLKERKIIATALGKSSLRPHEALRVGVGPGVPKVIAEAVPPTPERVHPDYELQGIQSLLGNLTVRKLPSQFIAESLCPANTGVVDYSSWIDALVHWAEHLEATERFSIVGHLQTAPILRGAASGEWTAPRALLRSADGVPPLPEFCFRDLAATEGPNGSKLLDLLEVESLDLERALHIVLGAIAGPVDDTRADEYGAALAYIRDLWDHDSKALEDNDDLLGDALVPVRTADGAARTWGRAEDVYFGTDWFPESLCESLYGPIGESEFLGVGPATDPDHLEAEVEFYRLLGVADEPRLISFGTTISDDLPTDHPAAKWRKSWPFRSAFRKDNCRGQPFLLTQEYETVDRLAELLEHADATNTIRLAEFLASVPGLLDSVEVRCGRPKHDREEGRFRTVASPGAQLVETVPWIPVEDGSFVTRDDCWTGVLESQRALGLRETTLPTPLALALGVPTPTSPTQRAIGNEFDRLCSADPELEERQTVETARFLVNQLALLLHRLGGAATYAGADTLPATRDGELVWAHWPMVADRPGAERLPGLEFLVGSTDPVFHEVYDFGLASEIVTEQVLPGQRVDSILLSPSWREAFVAYLVGKGGNLDELARWIGRLEEYPTESLVVRLEGPDDSAVEIERDLYLEVESHREKSTTVRRGVLYRKIDGDDSDLAEMLAQYIQSPQRADQIDHFLDAPESAMKKAGVIEEDFAVAREALAKYAPAKPVGTDPFTGEEHVDADDQDTDSRAAAPGSDESEADGEADVQPEDDTADVGEDEGADEPSDDASNEGVEGAADSDVASRNGSAGASPASSRNGSIPGRGRDDDQRSSGSRRRPSEGAGRSSFAGLDRAKSTASAGSGGGVGRSASGSPSSSSRAGSRDRLVSYVVPDSDGEAGSSDEQTVAGRDQTPLGNAGVEHVKKIEEAAGRTVEVMPHNNPGYDLTATDETGTRWIEVKATAEEWDAMGVAMTTTEFEYAEVYEKNYWLYVVEHALTDPTVWRIQDPFGRIGRYMFDEGWRNAAEQVTDEDRDGATGS